MCEHPSRGLPRLLLANDRLLYIKMLCDAGWRHCKAGTGGGWNFCIVLVTLSGQLQWCTASVAAPGTSQAWSVRGLCGQLLVRIISRLQVAASLLSTGRMICSLNTCCKRHVAACHECNVGQQLTSAGNLSHVSISCAHADLNLLSSGTLRYADTFVSHFCCKTLSLQRSSLVTICSCTSSWHCQLSSHNKWPDMLSQLWHAGGLLTANAGSSEDVCWGQSCSCPALNAVPAEGSITQRTALRHGKQLSCLLHLLLSGWLSALRDAFVSSAQPNSHATSLAHHATITVVL